MPEIGCRWYTLVGPRYRIGSDGAISTGYGDNRLVCGGAVGTLRK